MCRRCTGSAFAVLAWVPSPSLRWLGERPFHCRSSPIAQRGFCRDCGSPVPLAYDASPTEISVHVEPQIAEEAHGGQTRREDPYRTLQARGRCRRSVAGSAASSKSPPPAGTFCGNKSSVAKIS
ncbi:GFA family protein [Mesorhizobium sp. ES1-4]|nr:GFA family protein [Mesorhizobium sp. ES1-4]